MNKIKLLVVCLLLSSFSYAQETNEWTLQECIDYALKNNISVKRSDLSVVQNQAAYNQSKADLLPSLNARATHAYNFGQNVNPVTNLITDLDSRTNTFGLSANVTLFNGFANYNTIKQNSFLVDASVSDLVQARNDLGLNVAQAYLQVIFNKELLEAAKLQLATAKEQNRRTKVLVENGALALADELQTEAQEAINETQVINRQNDLNIARLQLMQLLQLPYDPNFSIVTPDIEPENLEPVQLSSDEVYEQALTTQPIVKAAELRIEASELGLSAAKGSRLPSITAFLGVDTRFNNQNDAFGFSEQLDNNLGQNIGFNLNIPIFNNFQVRQAVQVARINTDRAELNDLETRNNLRQQVEQAYLNAEAALQTYRSNERQVESTKLLFDNLTKQKEAGAANITDLTVAQNNYNQALSDFIRAKYDYIFKLKILDFYQGKPLDF
ncbi:TolC family protein [Fulvivirga sp. RKSG066]|uniref:TolC family protein n=1 Tax=Fulvivirga aurantia TaxID=2529383 RepID=UPI0012BBF846|nr:TolC family protein [Fulvivirga aurantia]MTI21981.1 TolC family protein [Fulvivirga aurantia]